jgi:hypothetical protein
MTAAGRKTRIVLIRIAAFSGTQAPQAIAAGIARRFMHKRVTCDGGFSEAHLTGARWNGASLPQVQSLPPFGHPAFCDSRLQNSSRLGRTCFASPDRSSVGDGKPRDAARKAFAHTGRITGGKSIFQTFPALAGANGLR